ncbi:MAG: hypothetical protein QUS33_14785 [Dehalococcoidia bacterium]|nr:hypothetical protein [Dehalococcoidia bacterium]
MGNKVKTGREILDEFFGTVGDIAGVDKNVTDVLADLYQRRRLTNKNLSTKLAELREEAQSE